MFSKKITFSSPVSNYIEKPIPALQYIPDVYKKLSKRDSINHGPNEGTVKACIPFLDALTTGYIIPFPIDVCFAIEESTQNENRIRKVNMQTSKNIPKEFYNYFFLHSHPNTQIPDSLKHNHRTINTTLKLGNPWHIKTPPGYSCMFTNPFNRNLPFKIIDGIVDTDNYPLHINFPFFWTNDPSIKETYIAKGSPMALVIPFKRENWQMETIEKQTQSPFDFMRLGAHVRDAYKKIFWNKKSYK